ncbi:MAG: hypothetical protein LLF94_11605 [Chlamydiales bacterium]|nr:hypothetical protein [Chlamydiales bacterium]
MSIVLAIFCVCPASGDTAKKKLLVLIIASDNHPAFLELQDIWKSYMNAYPEQITAYFIKGDATLDVPSRLCQNTLYTKTPDNYKPGILKKTLLSFEAMQENLSSYDYVLRTNLSSVYNFPKLLAFLETLPKEKCYAARPLVPSYEVPVEYANIPFGWGAGFIVSTDLVKVLIEHKDDMNKKSAEIPDDVLIGECLHKLNIPIIATECHTFTTRAEWNAAKNTLPANAFHFRAKSHYVTRELEDLYEDECIIASELAQKFYPHIEQKKKFQSSYPLTVALETVYKFHAAYPSAINERLVPLCELAKECATISHIDAQDMPATWGLLQGLSLSTKANKRYTAIDEKGPRAQDLLLAHKLATDHDIHYSFTKSSYIYADIDPSDLLCINKAQSKGQLAYILTRFHPTTSKYIVVVENTAQNGQWAAVTEFLANNPEWQLQKDLLNNHNLLVLKRM